MADHLHSAGTVCWDGDGGIKLPRHSEHTRTFLTTTASSSNGSKKIIHYDFAKLVRWTALATLLTQGTLFRLDRAIYFQMGAYAMAFVFACSVLLVRGETKEFEQESLDPILEISDNVQRFCPFLFGMFVSIILSRWWNIRTNAVGAIADHIMNISGLVVSMGARILQDDQDWQRFREVHMRFVKYGLASLAAVANESRGEHNYWQKLVDLGILTDGEKTILMETSNTAVVLWCWISAVAGELLEMLKIPPPNYNVFFQEVRMGVLGIHELHKYLRTQLPFPYVHMITLLVNVNNLVMAVAAGLKFAIAFEDSKWVICVAEVCQFLLVPLLYQGLLQICVFLADPMGNDIIDFPIREYQLEVNETCCAQVKSTRQLYDMRRKAGASPLPNAHIIWSLPPRPSPAKAPPAPAAPPTPAPAPAPPSTSPPPAAAPGGVAAIAEVPAALQLEMEKKFEEVADRVSDAIARGMAQAAALHKEKAHEANKAFAASMGALVSDEDAVTAGGQLAASSRTGLGNAVAGIDYCCQQTLPLVTQFASRQPPVKQPPPPGVSDAPVNHR